MTTRFKTYAVIKGWVSTTFGISVSLVEWFFNSLLGLILFIIFILYPSLLMIVVILIIWLITKIHQAYKRKEHHS